MEQLLNYYEEFCKILQDDNVAFLGLLVSSFPAALVMKYIPHPNPKQIFSISLALIQTYIICKIDTLVPICLCLFSYLTLRTCPKRVAGRILFHTTFSLLLIFKLLVFSELIILSYLVDGVLLLMVLRVCSFGYDYQLDKLLDGDNKDSKPSQICSFFQFFGYCFCFVGYWTGPFYTYKTYLNMLNSKTLIRSSKLALWHIRPLLIIVPLYAFLNTVNPLDFTLTDEFLEKPFAYKFFYQFVGFWTFKVKFYGGWVLAEGVCIACNLGTVEKGGAVDYSSIINIDIWNTEIRWELSDCVRAWNKTIQQWMKTYVYDTTHLPKSIRTDFVFGLSAFWHGLRPGYYLTFFSAAPMMKVQQKIGNLTFKARETSHLYEVIYRVIMWFSIRLLSCIFLTPFYILDLDRILKVWSSMYWVPQICFAVVFLMSVFLPVGERPKRSQDRVKSS